MDRLYSCETEIDVIRAWSYLSGPEHNNFKDLNVTGKDAYTVNDLRSYYTEEDGTTVPVYETKKYLRRYQILDENFRSVDIRDWDITLWINAIHRSRKNHKMQYHSSGRRQREHRAHGPSFHRQNMQAHAKADNEHAAPRIRNKAGIDDPWGYYERVHHRHYTCSKCWKDQSKAKRQWQKHAA